MNAARDRADLTWSLVVRARDGRCQHCGTQGTLNRDRLPVIGLEAAHIIPRDYAATRCDEDNGLALCKSNPATGVEGCHAYFTRHPDEWTVFVINMIGQELYDQLYARSHHAVTRPDFVADLVRLKQRLGPLQRAA